MDITVDGIIVKLMGNNRYLLSSGAQKYVIDSKEKLELGPCRCKMFYSNGAYNIVSYERTTNELKLDTSLSEKEMLIQNPALANMKNALIETAKEIRKAEMSGRDILIRYHNDTDGISSALILYLAIQQRKPYNTQHNSVIYKPSDALRDINLLSSAYRPLYMLVDIGSGAESVEAIKLLVGAGMQVIIVDHHPPSAEKIEGVMYVNPWNFGGDSNITTGVLTMEIARRLGIDDETIMKLAGYSMTGDKSTLHTPTKEDSEVSIVLDYLGVYSNFPNTLEFYKRILLEDRSVFNSVRLEALEKVAEIEKNAVKYTTIRDVNGARIFMLRLDKLVKKFGFPSKSKACGIVFDNAVKEFKGPIILIGYGRKLITVRLSQAAFDIGISARGIIAELKAELGDAIIAGGGHDKAASVKCETDSTGIVLNEFVKKVESILMKQ